MKNLLCLSICVLFSDRALAAESWAGYDSTKEPLEVKVVREWKDKGITCRYLTYTIGTFKGQKSKMAAFYG